MAGTDYRDAISREFAAQAAGFAASAAANDAGILDAILGLAGPVAGERWFEAACGPGIVARRIAPLAGAVHGVDVTPAMVELARGEAAAAGLENATFEVGDATATGLPDGSFDGAVTRFTLHHIPLPGRLVAEMARLVKPGGTVVVADHVADEDADARTWALEVERLRDPSHWASLPVAAVRQAGVAAGLVLEHDEVIPLTLGLDDWLARGARDPEAVALTERALSVRPRGTPRFTVATGAVGARTLTLQVWIGRWRRP